MRQNPCVKNVGMPGGINLGINSLVDPVLVDLVLVDLVLVDPILVDLVDPVLLL